MLLVDVIKSIFKDTGKAHQAPAPKPVPVPVPVPAPLTGRSVLNVGGGSQTIAMPAHYQDWNRLLLDIDPSGGADIVLDARKLHTLAKGQFDAVYCSHNLEHYFKHDVATVLSGFSHVLKPDGFVEVHVPDMRGVLSHFVKTGMELEDVLYQSPVGPISVLDVIYGLGKQIENTGEDFYAHKTGFTETSLMAALAKAGFANVWIAESTDPFSIGALAFKEYPSPVQFSLLGLSRP